ncbi:selenoprotein S isoform X2 [Myxocyprinus asiaticus]|uniref:selenoprotein S isoform X2 n=1 Tax=Myxocyprinus asiaticus TaxID=70543 RepID=UPI002222AC50|nr:selenoprotein S isoform X2 [Myxocyprinus asiaticus]
MEADGGARVRYEDVPPQNQDMSFILPSVSVFLSDYGWYLLFLCVGVYLLIQHLSKNRSWENQSPSVSAANQDPLSVARRQEALEASRQRMQEELDARAAEFKEKQLRLEEEKRRQKIEIWESMKEGKSYKGNAKAEHNTEEATSSTFLKPKTDKKSLRNNGYNPLSGDGGGTCSWRPGRRGPFAGG